MALKIICLTDLEVYFKSYKKLIPVDNKTQLLLKLTLFDKNRLVAFHSLKNVFFMHEKHIRVWMTLINILSLPTDSFCQPTIANC
jgi:hypothetical protein